MPVEGHGGVMRYQGDGVEQHQRPVGTALSRKRHTRAPYATLEVGAWVDVWAGRWVKHGVVWQEGGLMAQVESGGGGWGLVLGRVGELGWTTLDLR